MTVALSTPFVSILTLVFLAVADGGTGGRVVTGTVRDERGHPMHVPLAIDGDPPQFRWSSDAAGRFRIPDVPPDARDLIAKYGPGKNDVASDDLSHGQQVVSMVIYTHPGISVTVVNVRGTRMRGIRVVAERLDASAPAEGIYDPAIGGTGTIGLVPGRYRLSAPEHPSIVPQTIDIAPFRPVRITLRQRGGAALRVKIVDPVGQRLEAEAYLVQGSVSATAKDLDSMTALFPDELSKSHGASFGGLDPGTYTVILTPPQCKENAPFAKTVAVGPAGKTTTIRLPFIYSECP
jgi:hypothetical protein